jgi:uncharacterized protein
MSNNNWQKSIQERLSRRSFIKGMSVLGAGAAAGATLPAGVAQAAAGLATGAGTTARKSDDVAPFKPIDAGSLDDIVLPEGYTYQVIVKRGDVFTKDGKTFGDNADWTGWYAIDALTGGNSTEEGLLVVNCEYLNPLFVSGYTGSDPKTVEQINKEKEAVGFAVLHVKKTGAGKWELVKDSDYNKRFDGMTEIMFTGVAAEAMSMKTVIGTMGNCSGGQTPWHTALSCEENYQSYYGEDSVGVRATAITDTYRWSEDAATAQKPEYYGWVVELDPFSGIAKKRTAMGRFRHENVAIGLAKSGQVVAYMGDDARDEVVYKFVSEAKYDAANRDANLDILEKGTLYAANFGTGKWIPVVWEGNEERLGDPKNVGGYTLKNQADVLTYCNHAARALGATRTDRPEDIEIHPTTGEVYIAFTNNSNHGNFHGQITRVKETEGDFGSLTFDWDIFSVGGPQSGYSSPDNMIFDTKGNLWVVTDVSSSSLNKGIYKFQGNNAVFMLPTAGDHAGKAYRFANGPVEAEMTGPTWIGNDTLVLAVQHPGEESASLDAMTSHWPAGGTDQPRAGVVFIYGPFNA